MRTPYLVVQYIRKLWGLQYNGQTSSIIEIHDFTQMLPCIIYIHSVSKGSRQALYDSTEFCSNMSEILLFNSKMFTIDCTVYRTFHA
jgi:hypothetical protein